MVCRRNVVRFLLLMLSALVPLLAAAQDTLAPRWTYYGSYGGVVSYSNDGTKVLATSEYGFSIYDATTEVMKTHEEWESFQGALFGFDAKDVYYVVGNGGTTRIYKYNIATKARTALAGISETKPIIEMVLSKDGKKLAYSTNVSGSTYKIHIYSLETSTMLAQFDHSWVWQMKFVDSDTKVLVSGPALYDLAGNVVRSTNTAIGERFDVSPDGNTIITSGGSQIHAFTFSSFAPTWTYTSSRPVNNLKVSRDGASVLFIVIPFNNDSSWRISSLLISNGTLRNASQVSSPISSDGNPPTIAVSPLTDKVLLKAPATSLIQECKFLPATGGTNSSKIFAQGNVVAYPDDLPTPLRFTVSNLTGTPIKSLSVADNNAGKTLSLIDTQEGTLLASSSISKSHPTMHSPLGTSLFWPDDRNKLEVRRWDGSGVYAAMIVDPSFTYGYQKGWANEQLLWVNKGADRGIMQVRFDGTDLVKGRVIKGTFGIAAMTSDESRIAMRETTTGAVKVHNAVSGALIGTIPALSSNPIDRIQFVAGNRLVLHEYNATAQENTLRMYDVTSTPVLLHKFTESGPGDPFTTCGVVSPLGNYFAFGHTSYEGSDSHAGGSINVYRVADGLAVRRWNNQFLGGRISIEFSPDEFVLTWVLDSGMLAAAVIPTMPTSLSVSQTSVVGANTVTGTIALNRVANQDTAVHVTSSSGAATVPSTVTVAAGQSTATFSITTSDVLAPTTATLSATLAGATVSATLSVTPSIWVTSLTPSGNDLSGNTTVDVTVQLSGPATAGFSVPASSNAAAITVPSTVSFTEGATSAVVTLPVKKVTADKTVTVTIGGQSLQIRLHAPSAAVTSVTSSKTDVTGNDTIDITITLDSPAPA